MGAAGGSARNGSSYAMHGGALPKRTAARARDWTPAMVETFIETLADTCNVTLAARSIERSMTNVYVRRSRDAAFRAAERIGRWMTTPPGSRWCSFILID